MGRNNGKFMRRAVGSCCKPTMCITPVTRFITAAPDANTCIWKATLGYRARRRRKFQLTGESIAALEARLAALACQCDENGEDEGSGWDKVIISLR